VGEEQVDEPPSLLLADKRTLLANLIFCSVLLRILSTWLGIGLGSGLGSGLGLGTLARHASWVVACGSWLAERRFQPIFYRALLRISSTCARSSKRIDDTCSSLSERTLITFWMCSTWSQSTGLQPVEDRRMTATRRPMHSRTSS